MSINRNVSRQNGFDQKTRDQIYNIKQNSVEKCWNFQICQEYEVIGTRDWNVSWPNGFDQKPCDQTYSFEKSAEMLNFFKIWNDNI